MSLSPRESKKEAEKMVTNNTKTQTQRKHHIRTHSNSEEGGKDLNVLVTHLDGPDLGFASSIALLVPTGK